MSNSDQRRAELLGRLSRVKGVNYLPTWSTAAPEAWPDVGARMHSALDRELRFAAGLGFTGLRIWWGVSDDGRDGERIGGVRRLLDIAHARRLDVVLILFDSCGCDPIAEASTVTIAEIPDLAENDPRLAQMRSWAGERDLFSAASLVEVPWGGDPMAAVWEGWRPTPAYAHLTSAQVPVWLDLTDELLHSVADHPALIGIELANEPYLTPTWLGKPVEPVRDSYLMAFDLCRSAAPHIPLAIGAASAEDALVHDAALGGRSDWISLHCYSDRDGLATEVASALALAAGRVTVLSEWGCFPGLPDEAHQRVLADLYPIADQLPFFLFHLIAGYGPFALSALLYPSGVMRPGATLLRDRLPGSGPHNARGA